MNLLFIVLGLILLVLGGEFLVRSSVGLSFKLNLSKMVIGMTVVSFATSVPELLVSLQAALDGSPAMAINNVVGSNIANIGLVLGITTIIGTIGVSKDFFKLDWPTMVVFSLLIYYFLSNDNMLTRIEGIILFTLLIFFLIILIKKAKPDDISNDDVDDSLAKIGWKKILLWLVIGGVALYFGAEFLVNGAKDLAKQAGISEAVISVTLIAVGTSIPELAASVISAIKGEKAISLGNLIGSNIFNIGTVLGWTAIIKETPVTEASILSRDIFWMIGFALILLPLSFLPKKLQIGKYKGAMLFLAYAFFVYLSFM